jgi:hypothetical protein
MALECGFGALAHFDPADPDAAQALLRKCLDALLDPALWLWALGLTAVCAAIGALIGARRGRWLLGAVWGAALGPIGWIVAWFLPAPAGKAGKPGQPPARSIDES